MDELGVYIHIPYCTGICPYCDFHSHKINTTEKDSYIEAVLSYIDSYPVGAIPQKTGSLFFGGGTPSLLQPRELGRILEKVNSRFPLTADAEITLEANPESVTKEKLKQLKNLGFNRISFGIQSLQEKELAALGRLHSASQGIESILWAEEAGFTHISGDMMLNIPFQTVKTAEHTLNKLLSLPLDHISAYMLQVEEGTPLEKSSILSYTPEEEEQVEIYLSLVEKLAAQGFGQYEISNFAKAGGKSLHNLKYWEGQDYLGIGTSAHSFVSGERFSFPPDTSRFIARQGDWSSISRDGRGGDWEEYAMLRLRLVPGLDVALLGERYPQVAGEKLIQRSRELGEYVDIQGDVITLTPQGFLMSLSVTGHILGE